MRAATLFEIKIEWQDCSPTNGFFDIMRTDSINRYGRDEKHAETIGRKFAREVLKARGEIVVKVAPLKL